MTPCSKLSSEQQPFSLKPTLRETLEAVPQAFLEQILQDYYAADQQCPPACVLLALRMRQQFEHRVNIKATAEDIENWSLFTLYCLAIEKLRRQKMLVLWSLPASIFDDSTPIKFEATPADVQAAGIPGLQSAELHLVDLIERMRPHG